MRRLTPLFAVTLLLVFSGCDSPGDDGSGDQTAEPDTASEGESDSPDLARPDEKSVEKRVEKAEKRLKDSKAGKILWNSIETHGGLATWYKNGPLYFHYNYQPKGDRGPRNTYQTVDTWAARARHEMANNRDREYGWNGDVAWYKPADWEPPYDVRFWALTPYYFVGMPFVLADPGVNLEHEGQDTLEGETYEVLRATFGDVGISPDDYYVLYIHEDTHRLAALRYIVSYEEFFPDGGHSPEKLMTYDGSRQVDGITFSKSSRFYKWDPEKKTEGDIVTEATLSDVEFRPDVEDDYFEVPDGAAVAEPDDETDGGSEE